MIPMILTTFIVGGRKLAIELIAVSKYKSGLGCLKWSIFSSLGVLVSTGWKLNLSFQLDLLTNQIINITGMQKSP
jgi:hypothetical protein